MEELTCGNSVIVSEPQQIFGVSHQGCLAGQYGNEAETSHTQESNRGNSEQQMLNTLYSAGHRGSRQ